MIVELPKLYENLDEATMGPWRVAVGDSVHKGDALVELITDKTVMDLDAPAEGVILAIYAPEKSVVPVGYALCAIHKKAYAIVSPKTPFTVLFSALCAGNSLSHQISILLFQHILNLIVVLFFDYVKDTNL